jgi:hypothetical protein
MRKINLFSRIPANIIDFSLFFICFSSIIIYFVSLFSHHFNVWTSLFSFLVTIICYFLIPKKQNEKNNLFSFSNIIAATFIVLYVLIVGYAISPLTTTQKVGNDEFLRYVGIGDYYKHSYVITSLRETGIPPKHPYFPEAKFSYYYGYYLLPASLSTIVPVSPNTILYFYILFTTVLSLLLIYRIISGTIKNNYLKIICFVTTIFGTALDIIPVFLTEKFNIKHIENWLSQVLNGQTVENIYSSLIWTPQHFLATVLCVYLIYLLYKKQFSYYIFIPIFTFVFTSSIFIALPLALWMFIAIVVYPEYRKRLIISGLVTVIIICPFFFSLKMTGSLFSWYKFIPIPNYGNPGLSEPLFAAIKFVAYFLIEHGLLFFLCLPLIIYARIPLKYKVALSIGVFLPRLITLFIRTPGVNDLSLKVIQPVTLSITLLSFILIENTKLKINKIAFVLFVSPFIISGILGNAFEFYNVWKGRKIIPYDDTKLEYSLRKLPSGYRVMALSRDEWVFLIPVLGGKLVLTPSLYDSSMYLSQRPMFSENVYYEDMGSDIFINPTSGKNQKDIVANEQNRLSKIYEFISKYPADGIIVPEKEWVKDGLNVWNQLFLDMNISFSKITPSFNLFSYQDTLTKFSKSTIVLDTKNIREHTMVDHKVKINKGAFYLFACATKDNEMLFLWNLNVSLPYLETM